MTNRPMDHTGLVTGLVIGTVFGMGIALAVPTLAGMSDDSTVSGIVAAARSSHAAAASDHPSGRGHEKATPRGKKKKQDHGRHLGPPGQSGARKCHGPGHHRYGLDAAECVSGFPMLPFGKDRHPFGLVPPHDE